MKVSKFQATQKVRAVRRRETAEAAMMKHQANSVRARSLAENFYAKQNAIPKLYTSAEVGQMLRMLGNRCCKKCRWEIDMEAASSMFTGTLSDCEPHPLPDGVVEQLMAPIMASEKEIKKAERKRKQKDREEKAKRAKAALKQWQRRRKRRELLGDVKFKALRSVERASAPSRQRCVKAY